MAANNEIDENLLLMPYKGFSIGHCISKDLEMKKGLAAKIKDVFGTPPKEKAEVGKVILDKKNGFYLCHLVVKERFYDIPKFEDIVGAIKDLRHICNESDIKKLALPRISAGLDGHSWAAIQYTLNKEFEDSEIELVICGRKKGEGKRRRPSEGASNKKKKY